MLGIQNAEHEWGHLQKLLYQPTTLHKGIENVLASYRKSFETTNMEKIFYDSNIMSVTKVTINQMLYESRKSIRIYFCIKTDLQYFRRLKNISAKKLWNVYFA